MDLNIKIPMPKMHNHFEFKVIDVKSKQVIQEAKAENIVLDIAYEKLIRQHGCFQYAYNRINLGSGGGVLDKTRTTLFSQFASLAITNYAVTVVSPDLFTVSGKAVLGESDYIGQTITEVGFYSEREGTSNLTARRLWNHALLQDSEGNPISIGPKTNTQIIEIYFTLYVERTANMRAFPNQFTSLFTYAGGGEYATFIKNTYLQPAAILITGTVPSGTYDAATKTFTINTVNVASTSGNSQVITGSTPYSISPTTDILWLDLNPIEKIAFPNHTIFPPFTFSKRTLGSGDGTNKKFNLQSGFFKPGTLQVYVDDVLKTEGVDYVAKQGARQVLNNDGPYPYESKLVPKVYKSNTSKAKLDYLTEGYSAMDALLDTPLIFDFEKIVDLPEVWATIQSSSGSPNIQISSDGITWENLGNKFLTTYVSKTNNWGNIIPSLKSFRYIWISSIGTGYRLNRLFVVGDSNIIFNTPPASGAVISAAWQTEIPPKNANIFYNVQFSLTGEW